MSVSDIYSCFSDVSLSESIKIDEEFLDSDTVLKNISLQSLLYIQLYIQQLLRHSGT